MTYFCTDRSVHCSTLIREASFLWQVEINTETHSRTMCREWETLRHLHKWDVFMSSMWKRRQEDCRNWRWWVTPRKQHHPGTTRLMYIWIHRIHSSMPETYTSSKQKIPVWRREVGTKFLIKKLFIMNILVWKGKSVFSQWSDTEMSITPSRAGPNARNSWLTKFISFFVYAFCVFFLSIFYLIGFCKFVCIFLFWGIKSRARGEDMEGTRGEERIWSKFIVQKFK